ncbi:MAG: putative lipoprotein YajG [Oleispira sp.]|jgi:uncharacterized lipoprotein YajG|tara:strand:+ start:3521 stop:3781 length:261 start_codon:yes stop_codon:yes gene_type:complete
MVMKTMHISVAVTLLSMSLISGCNTKSSSNSTVTEQPQMNQEVKFSALSRDAFAQASESEPLTLNGLEIENDVISADFYNDLLTTQ